MKQTFIRAIGLILILILAACGNPSSGTNVSPAPPTRDSGSGPTPPTPTSQPLEGAQDGPRGAMPPGAVIVYRQSGGFAGLDEEWTIYADGRVIARDGSEWQSSPEQVSDLLYTIKSLGFFKLDAVPVSIVPCCDRFYYELSVVSGDLANSAATYDGAPTSPPGLSSSMQAVTNFLDRVTGSK